MKGLVRRSLLSPPFSSSSAKLSILIIDDDEPGQLALGHVLDSEGWEVRIVPQASKALEELARGEWTLVIANAAMTGLDGPLFTTLKELARAPAAEEKRKRVRVLFLVPTLLALEAQPALERERLPYSLKPLHLHDFLERVSDLLQEAQAISEPIRRVRHEYAGTNRRRGERRSGQDRRDTPMFASREDYTMTEEEIAAYEKEEKEQEERKKAGKKQSA